MSRFVSFKNLNQFLIFGFGWWSVEYQVALMSQPEVSDEYGGRLLSIDHVNRLTGAHSVHKS